jgi:hypothetical protein
MEAALRTLKIIWGALLAAVLAYAYLCSIAKVQAAPNSFLLIPFGVMALLEVAVLFFLRQRVLGSAIAVLGSQPEDPAALAKWRAGNIISWAFGVSIGLYGVVLRYTGFSFREVIPFLIAGFCLILFLAPRRPIVTR